MLTDEQIAKIVAPWAWGNLNTTQRRNEFARAIEAEATAPLLARIAELEKERDEWKDNAINGGNAQYLREKIAELEADAKRYRWLREGCDEKGSRASRIAANLYGMEWNENIDKAMKEQP